MPERYRIRSCFSMQNSEGSASASSCRSSQQSLSGKLSRQIGIGKPSSRTLKKTRKRSSLTSEASTSTGESSCSTSFPSCSSATKAHPNPTPPPPPSTRRSSSTTKKIKAELDRSRSLSSRKLRRKGAAVDDNRKLPYKSKSTTILHRASASTSSLSTMLVRDETELQKRHHQHHHHDASRMLDNRSRASREEHRSSAANATRSRSTSKNTATGLKSKSRPINSTGTQSDQLKRTHKNRDGDISSGERIASSRTRETETKTRRGRSNGKQVRRKKIPMSTQSESHVHSVRKKIPGARRRSSPSPRNERRSKLSTHKSKSRATAKLSSQSSQSLSVFMKKEEQLQTPPPEEVLEVRSAYTNLSRVRNRNRIHHEPQRAGKHTSHEHSHRTETVPSHTNQTKSISRLSSSFHGITVRRSDSFEGATAGSRLSNSNQRHKHHYDRRGRSGSRLRQMDSSGHSKSTFNNSFATLTTDNTSLSGSRDNPLENPSEEFFPAVPTFRNPLTANSQKQQPQKQSLHSSCSHFDNSNTTNKATAHLPISQAFHSSFANFDTSNEMPAQFHQFQPTTLPVLREEIKKSDKKQKLLQGGKKLQQKTNKEKAAISQQELAKFLEQCNARRQQGGKSRKKTPFLDQSSVSGERSCVSMPQAATISLSSSKGGGKQYRTVATPRTATTTKAIKTRHALNISRHKTNKRQGSQRTFFTSNSDPHPIDKHKASMVEALAEKRSRRARSKNRDERQARQMEHSDQVDSSSFGAVDARKQAKTTLHSEDEHDKKQKRSKSAAKTRRRPTVDDRPRSLSKSRRAARSDDLQKKQDHLDTNTDDTRNPPTRHAKQLQKLYSIRDFASQDADSSSDSLLDSDTIDGVVRLKTLSISGSYHGRNEGVADKDLMMTPPPPLENFSLVDDKQQEQKSTAVSAKKKRKSFSKSPNRKDRLLATKRAERGEDDDLKRGSLDVTDPGKSSPLRASGGETTIDNKSLQISSSPELEWHDSGSQRECDLTKVDAAEDVFSYYTWSSMPSESGSSEDIACQLERRQLKDGVRQSLLFQVFESVATSIQPCENG